MIHLRKCVLALILHSPRFPASHVSPLASHHRLFFATTPIAQNPFAIDDYLVANCGLSRAVAFKVSKKLSHLKSPSKPDAVLAFLTGLGLSHSDVATVVARDPRLLCADVGRIMAPRVVELGDLGLSRPEIARLVLTVYNPLWRTSLSRNLEFWLSVFVFLDELLQVLKVNDALLSVDLEKVAKPNMELLQRCGISVSDLPHAHKRFMFRMLARSTEHLQEALARVDEFGIARSSWGFPHALTTFAILSSEKITKNIQPFEKLGWSRDDISLAVRKEPRFLGLTEKRARRSLNFLVVDAGLAISDSARRPLLMMYSTECWLLPPRHCLMKFLKVKGLLNAEFKFDSIAKISKKFLHSGELLTRFRFQGRRTSLAWN